MVNKMLWHKKFSFIIRLCILVTLTFSAAVTNGYAESAVITPNSMVGKTIRIQLLSNSYDNKCYYFNKVTNEAQGNTINITARADSDNAEWFTIEDAKDGKVFLKAISPEGKEDGYLSVDEGDKVVIDTSSVTQLPMDTYPMTCGIFSGSQTEPLTLEGNNISVSGDIHSNDYVAIYGGLRIPTGVCESCKLHKIENTTRVDYSPRTNPTEVFRDFVNVKQIPDISQTLLDRARLKDYKQISVKAESPDKENSDIAFSIGDNSPFKQLGDQMFRIDHNISRPSTDPDFPNNGFDGLYLHYTKNNSGDISQKNMGTFRIDGLTKFTIKDKQVYYFDGNLAMLNRDSLEFEGSGMLIAKGDIIIGGQNFKSKNGTPGFINSQNGNIVFSPQMGQNNEINAILFAKSGKVKINTPGAVLNGAIIGDTVSIACDNLKVNATAYEKQASLKPGTAESFYLNYNEAKEAFTLKSAYNGKFVCADVFSGYSVTAKSAVAGASGTFKEEKLPDLVNGDVNGDGHVNVVDYLLLKKYVIGAAKELPAPQWKVAGDVNCDGNINVVDCTVLKKYILGMIDVLPKK